MIIKPRYNGPQFWDGGKSLDLYFARDKSLDPRITFTRSSVATYFDADGVLQTAATDEARFTHNPVTGECLGVYIEGAATNLLTYSEDFSNAAWGKWVDGTGSAAAVTPNDAIAPDGELTADLIVLDRGAGNSLSDSSNISQNSISFTNGVTYSGGLFIKAATVGDVGKEIAIRHAEGSAYDVFTLTTTWQRVSGAETATSGYAGGFEIANRGGVTADNTVSFHAWGAQLETGSRASSYIKTEASTVTRAADSASMTGANFSSWFNTIEGTMYWEGVPAFGSASSNQRLFSIRSDDDPYTFNATQQGGAVETAKRGLPQIYVAGVPGKFAVAANMSQISACINGGTVVTDSGTADLKNSNSLTLGFFSADGTGFTGTIKRLAYYPKRLTNGNLVELTDGSVRG